MGFEEYDVKEDETYVSRSKQKGLAKSKPQESKLSQEISNAWTQKEQNELETAMNSFPKGTPQRWKLIAECVPSRTMVCFTQ